MYSISASMFNEQLSISKIIQGLPFDASQRHIDTTKRISRRYNLRERWLCCFVVIANIGKR